MLWRIRAVLASISFLLVTLLFLDFTGSLHSSLSWLAEIQLVPAILAVNVVVIIVLTLLTLLFGRIYCSVICPLGILQDLIARVGRRKKKMPYSYSKAKSALRYSIMVVFGVSMAVGVSAIVSLLDPYAAYGRIANNLFQPVWMWGNNLLAYFAERVDSYAFYSVEVWVKSGAVLGIAVATLLIVSVLAWRNGRTYCNTICPVGTLLGLVSRFSLLKIRIDQDKCNKCGLCAANCKGACIDSKEYSVDNSRCVTCMDCLGKCKKGAISYSLRGSKKSEESSENSGRRGFLSSILLLTAAAAKAQTLPKNIEMKIDGGLADILDKRSPERTTPITPPGSLSARNFYSKCTACQLCVSACPNGVLKPSSSLEHFMQPEMSYNRGYCRPECTRCSDVCPSNAITKIDRAEKSATQIGHAVWIEELCYAARGESCDNCARHCPVQAIAMIELKGRTLPFIDTERCIGCGACENLCPSRPLSAIYVEGHTMHRTV